VDIVYVILVVGSGVAANLLYTFMFIARVIVPGWARPLGLTGTATAVPLAAAAVLAARAGADAWLVVLPTVFVIFAVVEVTVDVLLDVEIRTTRWLWPYLAMFYVAQWAVIGAAFLSSTPGGAVVLATYFACLAATAYSYRHVGHGVDDGRVTAGDGPPAGDAGR
jgi:hypothetical protein